VAIGSSRWGGLRIEPYKPDAVDADNDGIVQEGTVWERPKSAKFIVAETREDFRGGLDGADTSQLDGLILVDFEGREVQYTRSWEKENLTLGERLGTLGSKRGTVDGPPPQIEIIAPEPSRVRMSAGDIAELQREYPDFFYADGNLVKEVRYPMSPDVFLAGRPLHEEIADIQSWSDFRDYLKGKRLLPSARTCRSVQAREALDHMVEIADESGMYELTATPKHTR